MGSLTNIFKDKTALGTSGHSRLRWIVVAFLIAIIVMSGMLAWQLYETSPQRWCVLAKQGSPEMATSCVTMLIKLLDIKDHVVLGLMAITGLCVLSLAVVALGVRIDAEGAGFKTNIGADKTTIESGDGSSSVVIPTPPSEGTP